MSNDAIAIDDREELTAVADELATTAGDASVVSERLTAETESAAAPATDPGDCADIVVAYGELTTALADTLREAAAEAEDVGDKLTRTGSGLTTLQADLDAIDATGAAGVESGGEPG